MKYIICYDIKEDRVRARVVKYLEARALRVQYSVFTCRATAVQMEAMRAELLRLVSAADMPLLMIAPLCRACEQGLWMYGQPLEEDVPFLIV